MALELVDQGGLRVAVEGCGHGTLHSIYASTAAACEQKGWPNVDLLIIGGDFQAARNAHDLHCISMPVKYRQIGDFHAYYSGARTAPYLTIFIGGNHEASNYLRELYYGGWVAPNIYYLGAANVVRVGPLRIAGMSGIWKGYDYKKPHHERLPFDHDAVKSVYHQRELDVRKLLQIRTQVDVGLSHDWPREIEWHGNHKALFRRKGHLEPDARSGRLGSPAAKHVLDRLRPRYWFSAHLHVKFAAVVNHDAQPPHDGVEAEPDTTTTPSVRNEDEIDLDVDDDAPEPSQVGPTKNPDELDLDMEDELTEKPSDQNKANGQNSEDGNVTEDLRSQLPAAFSRPAPPTTLPPPPNITNKTTDFLALDKCLPGHHFLQLIEIPAADLNTGISRPVSFSYDREWLAITRVFAREGSPFIDAPRDKGEAYYRPLIEEEETWVEQNVVKKGKMEIAQSTFKLTAPPYDSVAGDRVPNGPREYNNPQTQGFCEMLDLPNPCHAEEEDIESRYQAGLLAVSQSSLGGHSGRGRGGFRGGHGGQRGGYRGGGGFRGGRGGYRGGGRGGPSGGGSGGRGWTPR